jgi:hypothetical protein
MGTDTPHSDGPGWPEISEEARAVLQDATGWQLRAARWPEVGDTVGKMATAVAAADRQSLAEAVEQLEEFGPLRVVTRLGDPPREPAPPEVRERINELIDALVPDHASGPGENGDSEQDRDDDVSPG